MAKINTHIETDIATMRGISHQDLAALGLNNLAYVKDVEVDGGTAFAIFAANGQQLAIMPDRAEAIAAAWENGLAPVTLQ